MGLSNLRAEASEKSERKFEKKLQFYSKVREDVASLSATKTIGKKNKNSRKRLRKLKAYDLSELAKILPEVPTKCKGPAPRPNPGKSCKSRQKLVLEEVKRLRGVFSSTEFQSDPLAVMHKHLQSIQPVEEKKASKKPNADAKKKRKKKTKAPSAPDSMEI